MKKKNDKEMIIIQGKNEKKHEKMIIIRGKSNGRITKDGAD
jgi:hypothetical protein